MRRRALNRTLQAVTGTAVLAGLFVVSRYNYLLFHSLIELFSIAVAWSVFLLVWNTRRISSNDALLCLGIAYFFIGLLDLFHMLAYQGMHVFRQEGVSNSSIQLWIAARGLEASSLLLFPLLLGRRFRSGYALAGYTALTAVLLVSIFMSNTFPDCYIEGQGLTVFKKGAEYVLCLVLVLAMALLYRQREQVDAAVFRLLVAAMAVTVAAELAFTLYVNLYGVPNMVGHLFKIISFFLVYTALVRISVVRPHTTVFRELGREKDALAKEGQQLQLLQQVSALFLRSETLDGALMELPKAIASHHAVPIVAMELHDADRGEMVFIGSTGINSPDGGKLRIPVDQTISGAVASTGKAVISLDVSDHPDYRAQALKALNVVTFVCVPMFRQEGVIGTLAIADRRQRPDIVDSADLVRILAGNLAQEIERRQVQDELRRSEQRRRLAVSSGRIGLWEADLVHGTFLWYEGYDRLFGDRPMETGESWNWWLERIHPEDRDRVRECLDRATEGADESWSCDYRFRLADGEYADIHNRALIERAPSGDAVRVAGTMLDVTELTHAQAELESKERYYRNLIYDLHEDILVIDREYRITDINNTALQARGLAREEVIGRHCYEVSHGLDTPCYAHGEGCGLRHVFETGEACSRRHEHVGAAEDRRQVDILTSPLRDEDGNVTHVIEAIRDVTDLFDAQRAVAESEKKFRSLVEQATDAIFLTTLRGRLVDVNRRACEFLGYTREELLELNIMDIDSNYAQRDRLDNALAAVMLEGNAKIESIHRRKDGSTFPVEITFGPIRMENEVYIIGMVRDIAERKRAEEEKERLQAQLNQAQKMESVGRLAGGVAHDFNNILSVILGHTEMALDQVDPSQPLFADLMEVREAAERSADLTHQLLAFARKQTVAPKVLDLNETLEAMRKMLIRLIGENIDLSWRPEPSLWPVRVDPGQIGQVLANLCVNARDAIEGVGRVTIETRNVCFDEAYCAEHADFVPGEYVMLAVSDDGHGMDKETLAKIYEPFFTTKKGGKGSGLGLATVYGIVKQNNGFIHVHSEPEQGATFRIYLPRHGLKATPIRRKDTAKPAARGSETILLVEDEPAVLVVTTKMLEQQGYTVLTAATPGEAVRLAREHTGDIQLLVTDVVMPEMNGLDLAENLLSIYPDIKRLFMSGYIGNVISHHGVLDKGIHFIQKPFVKKDLAIKVREVLEESGQNDSPGR